MRGLAKVKGLRGTVFDIFGYTQERRSERAFLARYEDLLDRVCSDVTSDNYDIAVLLASIPNDGAGLWSGKREPYADGWAPNGYAARAVLQHDCCTG